MTPRSGGGWSAWRPTSARRFGWLNRRSGTSSRGVSKRLLSLSDERILVTRAAGGHGMACFHGEGLAMPRHRGPSGTSTTYAAQHTANSDRSTASVTATLCGSCGPPAVDPHDGGRSVQVENSDNDDGLIVHDIQMCIALSTTLSIYTPVYTPTNMLLRDGPKRAIPHGIDQFAKHSDQIARQPANTSTGPYRMPVVVDASVCSAGTSQGIVARRCHLAADTHRQQCAKFYQTAIKVCRRLFAWHGTKQHPNLSTATSFRPTTTTTHLRMRGARPRRVRQGGDRENGRTSR